MNIARFFRERSKERQGGGSASVAKERLQIIVSHERAERGGGPDYLPMLRDELLEVVRRYVTVDPGAVRVEVERDGTHEVLELNITLPEHPGPYPPPGRRR
ncbi:cell division topological specificity factor MinE [Halorhodospira abdelmalekii]|uniref:cell division topological specificity factor MinE n=1 Tax=Halorhodospira abdelmalekii TaxID=421629 RepID=UPI001904F4ED|nr:cell division topological specificity factor MinE [Halorhodospira abdelmalekii]MBK1735953.1 cell division topological specificity factor MinE [Halorhodospira abdelmalekii]